jgi:TRAP-type C4-dicarboxylate transport system permease small subunit
VVDRVAEALSVSLLGAVALLVFANAASRYLAGRPLVWTEEAVAALVIWLAVIGGFLALRRRELIRVNVLVERLPPRAQVLLEIGVQVLSAMVFAYVAWQGWRYLGVFGGDTTPYFGLPKGVYMAALPIGCLAIVLGFLCEAREAGRRRP